MFDEDIEHEITKYYDDFNELMIDMLKKYSVFKLPPEYINSLYTPIIKVYYQNFILYNIHEDIELRSTWEKFFDDNEMQMEKKK